MDVLKMLGLRQPEPLEWVIIAMLLAGLFLLSTRLDAYITVRADTDPYGGYDAWLVVVGMSYTAVATFIILSFFVGWVVAAISVLVMFLTFVVAIIPMIRGDMVRAGMKRQRLAEEVERLRQEAQRKEREGDGYSG